MISGAVCCSCPEVAALLEVLSSETLAGVSFFSVAAETATSFSAAFYSEASSFAKKSCNC